MMRYLPVLLVLAGCGSDLARAQSELAECAPTSSRILEGRLQDALEASGMTNTAVLVERRDGRSVYLTVGTPNERYISSSTAKPVVVAAILDQVARRRLSMRTRAVDVLPGFAATATGPERDIELRHLLSFTSGIINGPLCWQERSWAAYVECVETLPLHNPDREPGRFAYSTQHLDIAGQMAVVAGGYDDWRSLFDEWRGRTGLFPGATWNPAFVAAASVQMNITAMEYMEFLRAVESCAVLPDTTAGHALCAAMKTDQNTLTCARDATTGACWYERNPMTWAILRPEGTPLHEDWHFGLGLWIECASPDFTCAHARRVSSVGVAGQYALIDREHRYRLVVTPSFGSNATMRGALFARAIRPLLEEWAALSQ